MLFSYPNVAKMNTKTFISPEVLGLNNKNIVIFSQILTDMAQKYDQLWSAYVMQDGSVCDILVLSSRSVDPWKVVKVLI